MRTFLRTLVSSALFFGSLLTALPDEATPKAPAAKGGTRLKFQAYDGDPKKPEAMTFQVNTLDIRQPSDFLQLGNTISKTNYKLTKFTFKERKNPKTGATEDVSELTVFNTLTRQEFVLVLGQLFDAR